MSVLIGVYCIVILHNHPCNHPCNKEIRLFCVLELDDGGHGIHAHLDLSQPLDAAVFACLITTFFTAECLGEFVVKNLVSFVGETHVQPTDVRCDVEDRSRVYHVPPSISIFRPPPCQTRSVTTASGSVPHLNSLNTC